MKKFISFVMAAAMVASLVPATAFAAPNKDEIRGTARVVNVWDRNKKFDGNVSGASVPEAQIRINSVDYQNTTNDSPVARFTLTLDNAEFNVSKATLQNGVEVRVEAGGNIGVADTYWYDLQSDPAGENAFLEAVYNSVKNGTAFPSGYVYEATATIGGQTSAGAAGAAKGTRLTASNLKATTDITLPTDNGDGATVAQNRDALMTSYAAGQGTPLTDTYTFVANSPAFGNNVFVNTTGTPGEPAYVTLADVLAWVAASGSAADKAKVKDGEVIATDATWPTLAAWSAVAKGELDAQQGTDSAALYIENTVKGVPGTGTSRPGGLPTATIEDFRDNEIVVRVDGYLEANDIISVDLLSQLKTDTKNAIFTITSDDMKISNDNADIVYVNVAKEGIEMSVRKVVDVAEEEVVTLDDRGLKIATNVGEFRTGEDNRIELKLSRGFNFLSSNISKIAAAPNDDFKVVTKLDGNASGSAAISFVDDQEVRLVVSGSVDEIVIYGLQVEADSAKSGTVATIKATSNGFNASAAVEVAKVVDYIVMLSVDEDEDVPVIYSGVNVDNYGITDDSDHWSLEVTAEESFPGAWSFRKGFNFELPEGVYVADVNVTAVDGILRSDDTAKNTATTVTDPQVLEAFFDAYQDGDHVNFEFKKRVFDDVDSVLNEDKAKMTFELQLVADPTFEGDVVLKLTGELVDDQEVTIAKFVKPYEVKAEQNDIIIDYRYTDIPTAITITEAEAGLWAKNEATFRFFMERGESNFMDFEDDPTFEIDSKSGMEIKNDGANAGDIHFTVKTESDAAATISMKDIQLFMNRSIPAGPYDLSIGSSLADAYEREVLFAPDADTTFTSEAAADQARADLAKAWAGGSRPSKTAEATKEDSYVADVCDYSDTVKEAFINVVTAGRDVDDASFTTKVVVPVGESYIVAGEKQIELDTPAYINEAGYTMLPIRAVATALGINNNNVLWDQPTKTVTILYGQRIITMTQGQKVVYVNGSAIPASAAVENTNSRTFLPMRDLATALGVTDITWDQATRTATLNGNQTTSAK